MNNDDNNSGKDLKKLAITAARLADGKKAEAVVVYDMAGRSGLTDFVLAATVDNPAQLEAVEDAISIDLKKVGVYALHRDGGQSKSWRVLDYGGIMVHVFERKARELFDLDKVYEDYGQVKWQEKREVRKAAPAAARGKKAAAKKPKTAAKKTKPAARKPKSKARVKPAAKKKKVSKKKK